MSMMMFDEVLKKIRAELNITQEQLAHELSISFSTLNRWENGHTTPSRLAKISLIEFCKKKNLSSDLLSYLKKL